MRNTKNQKKPVRVTTKNDPRVLRALWRILASRGQRPAAPEAQKDKDAQADLEWHLRMMS